MSSNALREATPADALGIAVAHVESWQAAYRGLMPDDVLDALSVERREEMWRRILTEEQDSAFLAVAERDGRIVGFTMAGNPEDADDRSDGIGELNAIYLVPEVWGQGIGRELLVLATDALRDAGYSEAILWVVEGNERSRRFYEIAGWKFDGGRRTECMPGIRTPAVRYRISL